MNEELKEFLTPTQFCDCENPKIKKLANKIVKNCKSEKEKVLKLFYWVKENIKFQFDYWGRKSSETLEKKTGMCTNKANLLIAFLRSIGIPAGYGILRVKTSEFYGVLMCPFFSQLVAPTTKHIYCGVFLDNKWIRCDPSVDKNLAEVIEGKSVFSQISGFDLNHKMIEKFPGMLEKKEFIANIDSELSKPPKHAKKDVQSLLNNYLIFLRKNKNFVRNTFSQKEIEEKFINWLKKRFSHLFNSFKSVYENFYKNL